MTALPFALDAGDVLDPEPHAVYEAGAVFGSQDAPVVLTVAWLDEPPGVRLEDVVREDLSRLLDEPAGVPIDHEPDVATALQRRLEAGARHWTVRFECPAWRCNLEVLEGDGGI